MLAPRRRPPCLTAAVAASKPLVEINAHHVRPVLAVADAENADMFAVHLDRLDAQANGRLDIVRGGTAIPVTVPGCRGGDADNPVRGIGTGVAAGDYFIYGITDDGVAAPVSTYSSGTVTVNAANTVPTLTVNQPDGVGDSVTEGATFNINYDLADAEQAEIGRASCKERE